MGKYGILVNILDNLRNEAPQKYRRYYPSEDEREKLDNARSRAFIHLFLKVQYGLVEFNEREDYITDDGYDGGIDAYFIDKEQKRVTFIQSKFRTNQKNFEQKEIDLDEILCMDVGRILDGELEDETGHEYNHKILSMQQKISEIEDIGRYSYRIVLLANLKKCRRSELTKLCGGYPVEIFDYARCYKELVFPVASGAYFDADEIRIHLSLTNKEGNEGRIGYYVQTKYADCKITVVFVPAIEIAKVADKYKNSILKYNPRCYLSLNGNQINPKIRRTIVERVTNEFALYNNGITILSDDTQCNAQIGIKDSAQLIVTNPQIINGGQTACTLAQIYREFPSELDLFENKEVLVKVITVIPGDNSREDRLKLIEELSRATNEQSPVKEADRRSNDEIQVYLQEKIFEDFGYFYDRKRGEFHDGLSMKYINKAQIIDRSVFLRIAAGVTGDASKARKTSDEYLFRWESFHELIQDKSMYRKFMYGYFCHQFLEKLEKRYDKMPNNRYGAASYGNALRYGKYAVVCVVSRTFEPDFDLAEYQSYAEFYTTQVLKQWQAFEKAISKKPQNSSYFYAEENDGKTDFYYNYDGYYKGKTVNKDLREYCFRFDAPSAVEAAGTVEP